MCQLGLLLLVAVAELQTVGLERLEVRYRRHLQPALLGLGVNLEIVRQSRREGHIAATQTEDAVRQTERLDDRLDVCHHAVQCLIRLVGVSHLHNLHLVELVQTVQTAYILTIRTRLTTEAGGVGRHLDGQLIGLQNHIAENIRHGHLGRRHEVEVIGRGVVHLTLLVGQLTRAEARSLIDHDGRLHLLITGLRVAVEEVVDQRTLQTSTLALIDGETGTRELHAQVEVDDVVLAGQLPVGQRILGQLRVVLVDLHHEVVLGRATLGNDLSGEVRQRYDGGVELLLYRYGLLLQLGRLLLHGGYIGLGSLGLLFAALAHQHTDLLGGFVLGGQRVVQLNLNGATTIVERLDLLDDGSGIYALLGQLLDRCGLIIADLLDCKHID